MRSRQILEILLKEEFVSLEDLAQLLKVTTRTVRNDIKLLNQETDYFQIVLSKKRGYYLSIIDNEQFNLYFEQCEMDRFEGKTQRLDSMLVYLLMQGSFITNQRLADKFYISIGQVKKDSTKLDNILSEYSLYLQHKAHYGLKIKGNLYDKLRLIHQYYRNKPHTLSKLLADYLIYKEYEEIANTVNKICEEFQLRKEGESFRILSEWLQIIYCYQLINEEVSFAPVVVEDIEKLKAILSKNATSQKCTGYAYLLYQLLLEHQSEKLSSQFTLKNFLEQVYSEVDDMCHTHFMSDVDFMRMIQLHIAMLLESKHLLSNTENALVKSLSQEFPVIMNYALYVVKKLEQQYNVTVSKEEIGYLASHMVVSYERQNQRKIKRYYRIALVCSSGGGVAQLMEMRFVRMFPNSHIEKYTLGQQAELLEFKPDLIFTIKALDFPVSCPVIEIKEVLGELDYLKIQHNLEVLTELGTFQSTNQLFFSMLNGNFFSISNETNYATLIEKMARGIEVKLDYTGYTASVLERESYLSTIYDNGVAIPHPMEMTGHTNVINIALLPKGIEYQGKKVYLVFMIALKSNEAELHQYISKKLYMLMQNKALVQELALSQNYQEFIKLLKIYL